MTVSGAIPTAGERGRRRAYALASFFIFVLLVTSGVSCIKEPGSPVSPTWDVDLTLPLANRSFTLSQIVEKDTSLLRVGEGNLITYAASVQASPTFVGDLLTLNPPDTVVRISLGTFAVAPIAWTAPIEVPWLQGGLGTTIPDTTASFTDLQYTIPTFESVTLKSGTINLMFQNNLPVPMDVLSPIFITDRNHNVIAAFQFVPSKIPAFSSAVVTDNLAGKTLPNAILVSGMLFHISGSATPVPLSNTGNLLSATVTTSSLTVKTAVFAEIPPQRLVDNDVKQLLLEDSTRVKNLALRNGGLRISATSMVDLDMVLKLRINELQHWSGGAFASYEDSMALPSHSSGSWTVDLSGYWLRSQTVDLMRSLEIVSSVILPHGSNGFVTAHDTDKVSVQVSRIARIIADSAVAVLKPTRVGVDKTIALQLGDLSSRFSGQVNIPSASLTLNASTSIGFPVDLYVRLGARRSAAGDSVFLSVPAAQRRISPGLTAVHFDPADVSRFFSSVIGKLPDSLRVLGSVVINPADVYNPTLSGVGTVGRNCSFGGTLDFQVPLTVGIVDGTYRDTSSVDEDLRGEELDNVNYGKMFFEIKNGLPVQMDLVLSLLNSVNRELLHIPQSGLPIHVAAATVDANGNTTAPTLTTTVIEMSGDDARQLRYSDFVVLSTSLVTAQGGSTVRFRSTDSLRVKVWSQLSYQANR